MTPLNDDQKHQVADEADEEIADEESPAGSSGGAQPQDIDETQAGVGLQTDDKGPQELDSEDIIKEADQHQE